MLQLSFQDFALLIDYVNKNKNHKTENRSTLYRAIHGQIRDYKNLHILHLKDGTEAKGEAAQVNRIFELVAAEARIEIPSRRKNRQDSDPGSNSLDRYKQIPKSRGDWEFTIAMYYWFHRDDARAAFAEKIDQVVFGLPFNEKFHLSRDQYTPLSLDERDFAVGPLRFSTDDSAATLNVHTEPRSSILDGGYPHPRWRALGHRRRPSDSDADDLYRRASFQHL